MTTKVTPKAIPRAVVVLEEDSVPTSGFLKHGKLK